MLCERELMLWRWLQSWFGTSVARAGAEEADVGAAQPATAVDPLDGELDLHTFRPEESADLVREYVTACHAKGLCALRIVHGKGKGTQRRIVHAALDAMPDIVVAYRLADAPRGGWGATLVDLRPRGLDP